MLTTFKTKVVGVDIRSEVTKLAVVDIRGNIIGSANFNTLDYPDVNNYVSVLSDQIVTLVEANGGYENIRSVGISVPSGNFNLASIVNSPNMPWKGVVPMAAMLRDRLGLAVALGNNAHVMALGEHAYGSAHGLTDFIIVTIGSGLGSCIFSNGRPHLGVDGFAGEVGHTCVRRDGRQCGCGKKGCLETYTAAKGIVMTAHEVMDERPDVPSLMRQVEILTPRIITEFCDKGDELAIETYRRTGEILGLGLANYASVLNPQAIIFTGGVSRAGDWLLKPAYEVFEKYVFQNAAGKVDFVPSVIDDDYRNVLGAAVLAWDVPEYSLFK
jgi:glucokinase